MADAAPVIHIAENTPEQVAYRLMVGIAAAENKPNRNVGDNVYVVADRKWLLNTYAECLKAVRQPQRRAGQSEA